MGRGGAEANRATTVREVALEAGVSTATVSRALSGSKRVSAELTERVLAAAERLGFAPNPAARSLAIGRTHTVGVVVPNLANPYFNALIKQMIHDAEADGFQLLIADSGEKIAAESAGCDSLLPRSDGLILCSPRAPETEMARLWRGPKPVVVFGNDVSERQVSRVLVDGGPAIHVLVEHLADLGHRRLVYLRGPSRSWQDRQRWQAVRTSAASLGLSVTAIPCGGSMEEGYAATGKVLGQDITAVVGYNDLTALGVIAGLGEAGLSVPEQISVTGFDDIPFARFLSPALTTVASPQGEAGAAAWAAMNNLLHGGTPGTRVILSCRPVIRDSTGPVAGR